MVCTSYRPPNSAISQYAGELEKSVATAKQMQCNMIITGDMNGHHSQWYVNDQTDNEGEHLHQQFTTYGLDQLVTFPTHIHQNTLKGCIDLVFTDLEEVSVESEPPVGSSDHITLRGIIQCASSPESRPKSSVTPREMYWCWSKADVPAIQKAVSAANCDKKIQ